MRVFPEGDTSALTTRCDHLRKEAFVPESPEVNQFIETARVYCELIETSGAVDRSVFFKDCFKAVAKLLSEVVELPDVGELRTGRRVSNEEYAEMVRRLKLQVGTSDYYQMIFDPWQAGNAECLHGSISDDLAAIWKELKHGLEAMTSDDASNAVCEWRFSFLNHWGPHHATHVLRPLFSVVFDQD
jgi:hypothetical protein